MAGISLLSHPTLPDAVLDLRGTPCPINFIRTKIRLSQLPPGTLLEVWLDEGEPVEQVPDSLRMEGYEIASLDDRSDFYALQVRQSVDVTASSPTDGSC
ncbi:MAG: sulfurtransferase TusA family protein [Prochlorotrichaceae cyanobacterium]|jgi:TusA-related sulfurtransferase